jgi:hypothetical protein
VKKVEAKQSMNKLMRFNRNRAQLPFTPSKNSNASNGVTETYDSRLDAVRRKREMN